MNKPLQGRRILVTRPAAQAGKLAALIEAQGGEPVLFPLLEISPAADDPAPLLAAAARLADYAIVVFISTNALDYAWPVIEMHGGWPDGLVAAAVGQSTATQLRAACIPQVIAPTDRFDSEALLDLPEFQAGRIAGKKVLILRGNGGRELLADTLDERGAQVDCVTCYLRRAPTDGAYLLSLLRNRQLDAMTISSSEGLRNLLALLDTDACQRLRDMPVFVSHQRIVEVALELGLQRVVLTPPADAGIIEGLCKYNWLYHE